MFRSSPAAAILLFFTTSIQAADLSSPVGIWQTVDDKTGKQDGLVQIWEERGELKGKILKIVPIKPEDDPNAICDACPGQLKGQPITGLTFMWGLKKDGDRYQNGEILDPEDGAVYKASLTLKDGGKKLDVRGFVGLSVFGRTQTWIREP
ncbi:DUF2147 domain-containing protein [Chitinivorax sp. B]|uniref:DUF2147 domain-containing protein n=1 Tax=Chitinivorax sp. B TaxID=2502235 RepID=UPI0010F769EB|nr:DUF2147 domain-containing protein [Chitinivorax sp. B]